MSKFRAWDNTHMAFDQKVVAAEVPLSKLAYGASSERFLAMRMWSHQLAAIQELRHELDAVFVKCLSNLAPVDVIEVGAGSGLHTVGLTGQHTFDTAVRLLRSSRGVPGVAEAQRNEDSGVLNASCESGNG